LAIELKTLTIDFVFCLKARRLHAALEGA